MPDMQEVFRMVTQKARPDPGFVERQRRIQERRARNRKIGAFVVVAAVIIGIGLVAVIPRDEPSDGVATQPTESAGAVAGDVRFLDVDTGEVSAGPELGEGVGNFAVSPDATMVAYIASSADGEVMHVADLDGSNVRAYAQTQGSDRLLMPSWSPDGSTIVYQAQEGVSVGNLFLLDVTSGDVRQLTNLEPERISFWLMSSAFVSGGDAVVFTWPTFEGPGKGLRSDLWSVPVTGGDPTHIYRNAGWVDASPDGSRIVFTEVLGRVDGELRVGDLWVADADGSNAERLVDGRVTLSRWSPDGTRISYDNEILDELTILDLSSGDSTPAPWPAQWQDWVDDATLLVEP